MDTQHTHSTESWHVIMRREWYIWLPSCIAVYLFVNGYYSGWTSWFTPNTSVPLLVGSDSLVMAAYIQRQLEGFWYYENIRSGYPFISTLYDFPSSFADMSIIKAFQWTGAGWIEIYHWFHITSYVLVFITTYGVFRLWNIQPRWAIVGALAFDFMPFHHERIPHFYFFWYCIVPLVYAYAWHFWQGLSGDWRRWSTVSHGVLFGIIGTLFVYWAVMSSAVLMIAGLSGSIARRSWRMLVYSMVLVGCMVAGLLVSYAPSLIYAQSNPTNMPLVREVEDSDRFALWPIALLTPAPANTPLGQAYHQFLDAQHITSEHNVNSFIGAIGLVVAGIAFLSHLIGRASAPFLRFLAVMAIGLVLYAAVGSLGLSISLYVTAFIRATNRIFIFISFAGIAACMYAIQYIQRTYGAGRPLVTAVVMIVCAASVWFDAPMSAGPYRDATWQQRATAWQQERRFFVESEALLGQGAAVYQLPALFFPEGDYVGFAYGQMRCYAYTSMYCSHGDVFGRDGYLFFRELQQVPVAQQLEIVAQLGFDGVMISRPYYGRNSALEREISAQLGQPLLERDDKSVVLYKIAPTGPKIPRRTLAEVIDQTGFLKTDYQIRQQSAITTPIEFWRPWLPGSIRYVRGLYDTEARGRWNDGKSARYVTIVFDEPLPKRFRLDVTALAWGRSVGAPVYVRVGDASAELRFGHKFSTQSVELTYTGTENRLILVPPFRERASEFDFRYLSFLLNQMTITPLPE